MLNKQIGNIEKILIKRKLEAAKSELSKFRDAIELCEKLPQNLDCDEDTSFTNSHGTWLNIDQ